MKSSKPLFASTSPACSRLPATFPDDHYRPSWGRHGACLALLTFAGLLQAWSLAWPLALAHLLSPSLGWGLQIASLALLVYALLGGERPVYGSSRTQGKWMRYIPLGVISKTLSYVLGWLVGTTWWLYVSMHYVGGLPAALAGAGVLALALYLSSFYVLLLLLWWRCVTVWGALANWRWQAVLFSALSFACAWTLAELLRGWVFTGFPWGAIGYAHVDGPLSVWAPLVGVYGVGAMAAVVAALLAISLRVGREKRELMRTRRTMGTEYAVSYRAALVGLLLAGALMFVSALLPQFVFTKPRPSFEVALLQGNIGQVEKFNPAIGIPQALQWYSERLLQEGAPLTITPETAIPMFVQDLPAGYIESIERTLRQQGRAAIVGIPWGQGQTFSNSAIALGDTPQAGQWRYDKHHLVPFGEFVPPLFGWFVRAMGIPLADFSAGAAVQAPFIWADNILSVNICYEDLFGEELARALVSKQHPAPTVLVNMSNIAWFGYSTALPQHLAISRMRALELERPMLRATNTGATAVIDHQGRVQALLHFETQDVLRARVAGRSGLTPYAYWAGRWGLLPMALCLIALWGVSWALVRRGGCVSTKL